MSPGSVFNGNESERSPTRSLSRSFEQNEHQREPEIDRGSPSEPSSRSKSKRSKGGRSRSKGDRQRWAGESDRHGGKHWQDAPDSDSNDGYDRKDRMNAENKRDDGSACTDLSFGQRKATEKLQETCKKRS